MYLSLFGAGAPFRTLHSGEGLEQVMILLRGTPSVQCPCLEGHICEVADNTRKGIPTLPLVDCQLTRGRYMLGELRL